MQHQLPVLKLRPRISGSSGEYHVMKRRNLIGRLGCHVTEHCSVIGQSEYHVSRQYLKSYDLEDGRQCIGNLSRLLMAVRDLAIN